MERLTRKDKNGHVYVIGCPLFELPNEANELIQSVADKCNDIEDILGDDYDLDRLRQMVEADRDGRCVVLPCKEGEKLKRDGVEFAADHWNIRLTAFAEDPSTASGKRVELFGIEGAKNAIKRVEE